MNIRVATAADVEQMVDLSDIKRTEYAGYSPVFWRKAADAMEKQAPFFRSQIEQENCIILVAEGDGALDGFIIAMITGAPPVYNPGGPVCVIDDFAVRSPDRWATAGEALLGEARRRAKARGAVLSVVVCGHRDEPKRAMLHAGDFAIASEWYVRPL